MNYFTEFEVGKCIELGRKRLDDSVESIINFIKIEYNIKKIMELDEIITIICNYFNRKKEDLLQKKGGQSGCKELVRIRQIISFISFFDYEYSINEIVKALNRHHSTIIYSINKALFFYEKEKRFEIDVDNCRNLLKME